VGTLVFQISGNRTTRITLVSGLAKVVKIPPTSYSLMLCSIFKINKY